jgi:hypothetical protein
MKPFDMAELFGRIEALLGPPSGALAPACARSGR